MKPLTSLLRSSTLSQTTQSAHKLQTILSLVRLLTLQHALHSEQIVFSHYKFIAEQRINQLAPFTDNKTVMDQKAHAVVAKL